MGGSVKKGERLSSSALGLAGPSSMSKGKETRRSSSPKKSAASAAGPAVEEDQNPDVLKLSKELSDFSVGASAKTSKLKSKTSLGSKLNLSSLKSALTKSESKKVEFEQPEGEEEDEE